MIPRKILAMRILLSICVISIFVCGGPVVAQGVDEEETLVEETDEPTETDVTEADSAEEVVSVDEEAASAEAEAGLELTVYNQNLGLVKEVRNFDLEAGENWIRYTDVASAIKPTSVHVSSLTAPTETLVLEQNYEYDLVSSQKLLQKYVDREISVQTNQGDVYSGILLSGSDDIILDTGQGLRVIRLGEVQEFSFPALPEGLITRPTLVWLLEAAAEGPQDLQVTYLTSGIDWRADYTALLAPDDRSLSLAGWVTVDNQSGATYEDAKLKLVAGDVHRVQDDVYVLEAEAVAREAVPTPQVEERAFFEYHIYQVQRPVTVRDSQTKQVEFVSAPVVSAEKLFIVDSSPGIFPRAGSVYKEPSLGAEGQYKAQVELRFMNDEESGLGVPLPEGLVRVYKEDADGSAEFVGEDSIDHTPKDEELSLYLGDAFDVVAERTQTRFRQIEEGEIEESIEITLRNHKQDDIEVRVVENLFRAQDSDVIESSEDYEELNASTIQYVLPVPADGESSVTYTVVYRW